MKTENNTIQHYEKRAGIIAGRYESANVDKLQQLLLSSLKNCNSILELGCGSGRDAAFLLKHTEITNLTITDGSEEMFAQAAILHPELIPYLKKLELPDGLKKEKVKFDGIYSIAALMHLTTSNIKKNLMQIAQSFTPNGILFISVCTKRGEQPPNDHRTFTMKSSKWWTDQVEETGLNVTEATESIDGLSRAGTRWLNITAIKPE